MKKLSIALAALLAVSVLAGCSSNDTSSSMTSSSTASSVATSESTSASDSSSAAVVDAQLEAIMDKMLEDVELPMMMQPMPAAEGASPYTAITKETAESMTGVSFDSFAVGISADAAVTSQAHSVVLLRANSAEEAATLAQNVAEKANPAKWICVTAERTIVAYADDVVLLVMSANDYAEPMLNSFTAQMGADKVTVVENKENMGEMPSEDAMDDLPVAPAE
ncbi:MAG: hypothetical protein H9882_06930 [Candidatus Fournierella pullistercoris]|uniref:Lipoprotein n=1 Tax=Candidatus Allofournierella pullistercoris TaxID=2838597 RepID=A0A948T2X8_9FIRM|nr:hypothetical protein [Candidatus Fournierella pullistercoris]